MGKGIVIYVCIMNVVYCIPLLSSVLPCYKAWFPSDCSRIAKSCDPSRFYITAQKFARNNNKILLGCKSKPYSRRFLFSAAAKLSTISQNLAESLNSIIPGTSKQRLDRYSLRGNRKISLQDMGEI